MAQTILKARNIHKSFYYPKKVNLLAGIDLAVQQGESVAIIGRSGEGKSTLLQLLGTLETACKGYLEIANQRVSFFNKPMIRNRHIGFVFQSFHLLEECTVLENVLMPARICRLNLGKGSQAFNRAITLLERVGLKDRLHFASKLLSGGEKQRVAIARALCNNPDLIFADEPSGNLDQETAEEIHKLLLELVKEGKSLIIVTHNQQLAAKCHIQLLLQEKQLHPLNG